MKFISKTSELIEKLKVCEKVNNKEENDTVGFLVQDNEVIIYTIGRIVKVRSKINADVQSPGVIFISGRKVLDVIERAGTDSIQIGEVDGNIEIKAPTFSYQFPSISLNPEMFPPELIPKESIKVLSIDKRNLKKALKLNIDLMPLFKKGIISTGGMQVKLFKDRLSIRSVGSNQMVISWIPYLSDIETEFIIEMWGIKTLYDCMTVKEDASISFFLNQNRIIFKEEDTYIYSSIINEKFHDCDKFVDNLKATIEFKANRQDFISVLERCLLVCCDEERPGGIIINVKSREKFALLNGKTKDTGAGLEKLSIETSDEDGIELMFNGKLFLAFMKSSSSEKIVVKIGSPLSPIAIQGEGEENLYIITPLRMKE